MDNTVKNILTEAGLLKEAENVVVTRVNSASDTRKEVIVKGLANNKTYKYFLFTGTTEKDFKDKEFMTKFNNDLNLFMNKYKMKDGNKIVLKNMKASMGSVYPTPETVVSAIKVVEGKPTVIDSFKAEPVEAKAPTEAPVAAPIQDKQNTVQQSANPSNNKTMEVFNAFMVSSNEQESQYSKKYKDEYFINKMKFVNNKTGKTYKYNSHIDSLKLNPTERQLFQSLDKSLIMASRYDLSKYKILLKNVTDTSYFNSGKEWIAPTENTKVAVVYLNPQTKKIETEKEFSLAA